MPNPDVRYDLSCTTSVDGAPRRRHRRGLLSRRAFAGGVGFVLAGGSFAGGWFAHALLAGDGSHDPDRLARAVLPPDGVTLDVLWGNLPQRLTREQVIVLDKFKAVMDVRRQSLSAEQIDQLENGSDQAVHFDAGNATYVLNVLWALGLANNNPVLTEGAISMRGRQAAGNYASTGGWTLGAKPGPTYLAALDLIALDREQQAVVNEVASNTYRPCCNNPTSFPDCNHGMAALGLIELMAAQGASADDIFTALKQLSPFWFPSQYRRLATYFEKRREQKWDGADPRLVMAPEHSSGSGWRNVDTWLQQQGVSGDAGGGGGCTV